ncbi:MAG: YqiJ family protein [Phycisphaeraceae bacterium]
MTDFFLTAENIPFMISLGAMVMLGLLEGVTAVLGLGVSSFLDSLLPEVDVDVDVGLEPGDFDLGDVSSHGPITKLLGWLRIGRVPVLILLVVYLFAFGFIGLFFQAAMVATFQAPLPAWLAVWPVFVAAIYFVHVTGGVLAKVIPKDETEAVSESKFVGRVACITLGTARMGNPAQARLKDSFGLSHYVMVEPDDAETSFEQGTNVLLIGREGAVFRAIDNPNEALVD